MDKEEILRRSREEEHDEMEVQRRERGLAKVNRWTVLLFYLVIAILTNYSILEKWVYFAFMIVACIPATIWFFYSYWKTRDGGDMVSAVVMVVCMLMCGHLLWIMH